MVWGFDNRQAAVRAASPFWGREMETSNIEIKSDSTSNPYIALAGMIAAGLDGIDHKIDPGEPTQIDPADYADEERQRRIAASRRACARRSASSRRIRCSRSSCPS